MQVGRKNSDLAYPNEKSLSRTHCRLRLVSLGGRRAAAKEGEENSDEVEEPNRALFPANEEEERACENAMDGLAIVLDDLGR